MFASTQTKQKSHYLLSAPNSLSEKFNFSSASPAHDSFDWAQQLMNASYWFISPRKYKNGNNKNISREWEGKEKRTEIVKTYFFISKLSINFDVTSAVALVWFTSVKPRNRISTFSRHKMWFALPAQCCAKIDSVAVKSSNNEYSICARKWRWKENIDRYVWQVKFVLRKSFYETFRQE